MYFDGSRSWLSCGSLAGWRASHGYVVLATVVHMWHPQVWDLQAWKGKDGVAVVTFANPEARAGGKELPEGAFSDR